jgi:hypothetical protein
MTLILNLITLKIITIVERRNIIEIIAKVKVEMEVNIIIGIGVEKEKEKEKKVNIKRVIEK